MILTEHSVGSRLRQLPRWEETAEELAAADYASECRVYADDWTENVIFQLIRHNGMKATPQVYTYHVFAQLSPGQIANQLQDAAAWPLSSPPSPWTRGSCNSPLWAAEEEVSPARAVSPGSPPRGRVLAARGAGSLRRSRAISFSCEMAGEFESAPPSPVSRQ